MDDGGVIHREKRKPKVNFSIGKKRKSTKSSNARATFDDDKPLLTGAAAAALQIEKRESEGLGPLVIPLLESRGDKVGPLLASYVKGQSESKCLGVTEDTKSTSDETGDDHILRRNHDSLNNPLSTIPQENNNEYKEDKETKNALHSLIQSATDNSTQMSSDSTNFNGKGSLVIPTAPKPSNNEEINEQTHPVKAIIDRQNMDDDEKFKCDLAQQAEDVSIHSSAYVNVPIAEFGAAMLRGMGWKGTVNTKKNNDSNIKLRPQRLGIGATAIPPSLKHSGKSGEKRHWARKGRKASDISLKKAEEEKEKEWKDELKRREKMDVQRTMQLGSVVRVRYRQENLRAKVIKLLGVSGLNKILVRFEGENDNTSVKKGDVSLLDQSELDIKPFLDNIVKQKSQVKIESSSLRIGKNTNDLGNVIQHGNGKEQSKHGSNGKRSRSRSRSPNSDNEHREKRRKSRYDRPSRASDVIDHHSNRNKYKNDKKSNKKKNHCEKDKSSTNEKHWLIPNIRVRIVTKKVARGRQYLQKGVIMDVLQGGSEAVIQMTDGELLEKVPERYLETALPKVGGKAIILSGPNKYSKGKLLERNSDTCRGIIQVFEDMNVVTVSLDDMAEFCGLLDDDVNESFFS